MAVQVAVPVHEAPRDLEGLMGLGTYVLKKLGKDVGFGDKPEEWAAFLQLNKERMCEAISVKLKAYDAAHGGKPAPTPVSTPAPVAQSNPTPPFDPDPPKDTQAASTEKPKREPRHNGKATQASAPAPQAPNEGSGKLITEGPTGGDFMILAAAVREQLKTIEVLNKNVSTLITNVPNGAAIKALDEKISKVHDLAVAMANAQVGIVKALLCLAEASGMERSDLIGQLADSTGVKEVLTAGKD